MILEQSKMSDFKVKFIYSEKAEEFCEISTLLLTGTTWDKSKVEISQNFVAFSEYTNFNRNVRIKNISTNLVKSKVDWARVTDIGIEP